METNIPTHLWGPGTWDLLYSIAFSFSTENSENSKHITSFLESLQHILPCEICKQHFKEYLKANVPDLSSQISFQNWVNNFHNTVRKKNGKEVINLEIIKKKFEIPKEIPRGLPKGVVRSLTVAKRGRGCNCGKRR